MGGHNQRGQCMNGTKSHIDKPYKLDIPQFKEYAISQIYCGYNSTNIIIGSSTEGLNREVYELGNFFASRDAIGVTVPSRIRITNIEGRNIRKSLAKFAEGSDGYERIEKEHLEYVYKTEPRMALFSAPTTDLIKKDYSKKESISDYNQQSNVIHEQDSLVVANSLDRLRIEAELNRMKSANIAIMKKLQYRAMKLSCFDASMNSVWNFDVKHGILQRILNINKEAESCEELTKWPPTAIKQLLLKENVI